MKYNVLRTVFSQQIPVRVDRAFADQIVRFCLTFEVRRQHAQALNSPYLGLYDISFTSVDRAFLFSVCGTTEDVVRRAIKNAIDQQRKLYPKGSEQILDPKHRVRSDPFNMLVMWLIHLALNETSFVEAKRLDLAFHLAKILFYKFFTSLINRRYFHGANEDLMQLTLEQMSAKYAIRQAATSTWKLLLERRARDLIGHPSFMSGEEGIHYRDFLSFEPDYRIYYGITDPQTRIRNQVNEFTAVFRAVKESGARAGNYSLTYEIDGEQQLRTVEATYDRMLTGLSSMSLTAARFIDTDDVKLIAKFNSSLREDLIRTMLNKFLSRVAEQNKLGQQDEVITVKEYPGTKIISGYRALFAAIVTYTYVQLIRQKVDISQPVLVLEKAQDLYRASRVLDPNILAIKNSVEYFIRAEQISNRDVTVSSLKIAFILYVLLRGIRAIR